MCTMKRAFTLIEINLAILVMAGGILSIVVLYSLGYRESRQSREDIVSTGYSDAALAPFVAALSDRNLEWSKFDSIETTPEDGWGGYVNEKDGTVKSSPDGDAIEHLSDILGVSPNLPDDFHSGMVVYHDKGSGVVKLGFRTARKQADLLTAPLYYTEVRFQGGFK